MIRAFRQSIGRKTLIYNMKIGYLRVSTEEQNEDRQMDTLLPICDEIHIEKLSATAKNRPIFESVLTKLQPSDTLVVWSLDRAFRNVRDALRYADTLKERRINFHIVSLGVDTATADGRLAFTVVAAVAEHERNRLSERTKQGLEAARRRGKRLGAKPKVSNRQVRVAAGRIEAGEKIKDVAYDYNVHPWTLSRRINQLRIR